MKMKIALAALACSGSLLAFPSTSAPAAPLSGRSQSHGLARADHPLLQKVHRWWRRGWGAGPYGYGYGNGYSYYRPYYPAYRTVLLRRLLRPTAAAPAVLLLPAILGAVLLKRESRGLRQRIDSRGHAHLGCKFRINLTAPEREA
jgi:hypothetical protein